MSSGEGDREGGREGGRKKGRKEGWNGRMKERKNCSLHKEFFFSFINLEEQKFPKEKHNLS